MRHVIVLSIICLGCVDGRALERGLRGEPDPPVRDMALDATPDATPPPDAGTDLARPDAAPDMAPDPRCGPEICNDLDDDCDGSADEGVADCCVPGTQRACGLDIGACTVGDQFCTVDLEWSACSGDPPTAEICDGAADEDCDGQIDEGVANACGGCGPAPDERCNTRDDDCDGAIDEGVTNACGTCGDVPRERCNGDDDDCDGTIDEGVLNACGACDAVPEEECNGRDDDCDGAVDERVLNACGACGPPPPEDCNGLDDDCDGAVDEGTLNACGDCGPAPDETCDGVDRDCDGRIDEAACYAFVLDDDDAVWRAPPGLNASPLISDRRVTALFATVRGGARLWAAVGRDLHVYDVANDAWRLDVVRNPFGLNRIDTAIALPVWWNEPLGRFAAVTVTEHDAFKTFNFDPLTGQTQFIRQGSHVEAWAEDPRAPRDFPLEAAVIDLFDNQDYWPGDVAATCGMGKPGPVGGILAGGRLYTADAGTCFRFMDQRGVGQWAGFARPGAPPAQRVVAWAYINRVGGRGSHVIILDRPVDGR